MLSTVAVPGFDLRGEGGVDFVKGAGAGGGRKSLNMLKVDI